MTRAAIVTGGDSGIGKASAVALAGAGCDVGVTFHTDQAGAEQAVKEIEAAGRRGAQRQLDVTDADACRRVLDELADELGGLDVLVNNAGVTMGTPFLDVDLGEWNAVLATNLTGAFVCAQHAARRMVERGAGGRVVNITSVHEHIPLPGASAYCASKGGLGLLTKVMALELGEHGITVNAVAPGEIATPMTGQHDVDPREQRRPGLPAGRPGDARDVAATVAFLASPGAAYVTGASVVVDGGLTLTAAG